MKVKSVEVLFSEKMWLGDKLRVPAALVHVSDWASNIPYPVVQVIAAKYMTYRLLVVEAARPSWLSSQIVGCWIVVPKNNIVLEGKCAGRAAALVRTRNIKAGRSIGDNRIVGEQRRASLPEVERECILRTAEVA